jgi:3-deoxy-D-manno-octulosonate 8-phosphate phosphatase (KDO 8-P phosphatase)
MIKALFFDVDGCLTDGRLYVDDSGRELKVFDTKDGHGIRKALAAGLAVAWISGRTSKAAAVRAKDLGVRHCRQGIRDKVACYDALCRRFRVKPSETAVMGDDEPDVGMMRRAGFSACPSDATPAAKRAAKVVLSRRGGRGAAREFIDLVLARAGRSGVRV